MGPLYFYNRGPHSEVFDNFLLANLPQFCPSFGTCWFDFAGLIWHLSPQLSYPGWDDARIHMQRWTTFVRVVCCRKNVLWLTKYRHCATDG